MKLVIRTFIFHLLCIIVFSYLYFYLSEHFQNNKEKKNERYNSFIDFFLLSTTIQTGVGISDLYPISYNGKLAVIVQQIIMLLTHIITIYIFTL
jgi:hypothetical protein